MLQLSFSKDDHVVCDSSDSWQSKLHWVQLATTIPTGKCVSIGTVWCPMPCRYTSMSLDVVYLPLSLVHFDYCKNHSSTELVNELFDGSWIIWFPFKWVVQILWVQTQSNLLWDCVTWTAGIACINLHFFFHDHVTVDPLCLFCHWLEYINFDKLLYFFVKYILKVDWNLLWSMLSRYVVLLEPEFGSPGNFLRPWNTTWYAISIISCLRGLLFKLSNWICWPSFGVTAIFTSFLVFVLPEQFI